MASEAAHRIARRVSGSADPDYCSPSQNEIANIVDAELREEREAAAQAYARGFAEAREMAAKNFETEKAASRAHDAYQVEAHKRGDVRHADKYEDLSEATKEWDRVLCRWVAKEIRNAQPSGETGEVGT